MKKIKIKFCKLSNSAKVFYVDVTGIIGEDHSRLQTERLISNQYLQTCTEHGQDYIPTYTFPTCFS